MKNDLDTAVTPANQRTFQLFGRAVIALVILIAVSGLLGWVTGWQLLTSLRPDLIPIAPSTAVAFLLLSGVILTLLSGRDSGKWIWLLAGVTLLVTIFGLLEVVQYFTGLSLDLEDVLVPNLGFFNNSVPAGRMSPGTGALFFVAGLALLVLLSPPARRDASHRLRDLSGVLGCLVSAAGLTFSVAYLLGQPLFYNLPVVIPISALASTGMLCLGVAIVAAVGAKAFPGDWFVGTSTRARLLRAIAPFILLIGVFNFIADPLAHFLSGGNLALATAIMAVAYMLVSGLFFALAARRVGASIDKAELARQSAVDELRTLFAALSDVILTYDAEGRYLQIAPTNPALLYLPAAGVLGKRVEEILPPDVAQIILQGIRQALTGNFPVHVTYSLQIGGREIWFEAAISPKSEKAVFFIARDVTASRQAQVALQDSEERFRSITEQLSELVTLNDSNGMVAYASPASLRMFGIPPAEMVGQYFMSFVDPSAAPLVAAAMEKTRRERAATLQVELLMKRRDGSTFMGELNGARHQFGGEVGYLIAIRDVSERKRSEETRTLLAAIVESTDDAVLSWTLDGIVTSWNPAAERLFGYSAAEMIGSSHELLLPPGHADELELIMQTIRRGEGLTHLVTTRVARDGRLVDVSLSISPVRDSSGRVVGAAKIARDVTEQKRMDAELQRLNRDLEKRVQERTAELQLANLELARAARMKDEFLASMSHELRTPLNGILGLSESMQMNTYGSLNEKQLRNIKLIEESGRHLLDLINDILDLSKIEAGKFDMQMELTSLSGVCQASLQMMRGMALKKRLQTSLKMDPPEIVLRADVRRLKQMLVNLLSNAVKFTPEGGSLGIDVKAMPELGQVQITVWDTGIGIAPEDLPRLFQVFVQLDSSLSRQYAGTGLGLALVKRLAELHNGAVDAQSQPGKGSRFTISLPWEPGAGITVDSHRSPLRLRSALSFDEDEDHAGLVTVYFHNLGILNRNQPVALGAVEVAAALLPDVVLAHLNLPDKPGLQLLRELKADPRTQAIPVLLMSVEDRRAESLALGAGGFLLKPFSQQDLQSELDRALASAHLPPQALPFQKVMMVDDDRLTLDMLGDFFRNQEVKFIPAQSGTELLESIEQVAPDILLVDVQMPGISGLEVMQYIRAHPNPRVAALPMVAVTALAMSGDRERCLQAGANAYLTKPVRLDDLLQVMKDLCQPGNSN